MRPHNELTLAFSAAEWSVLGNGLDCLLTSPKAITMLNAVRRETRSKFPRVLRGSIALLREKLLKSVREHNSQESETKC